MRDRLKRWGRLLLLPVRWCVVNPASIATAASLAAIALGFWLAWPPLGLIVPGTLVFTCLATKGMRGGPGPP